LRDVAIIGVFREIKLASIDLKAEFLCFFFFLCEGAICVEILVHNTFKRTGERKKDLLFGKNKNVFCFTLEDLNCWEKIRLTDVGIKLINLPYELLLDVFLI